jgi:hypothetical protein
VSTVTARLFPAAAHERPWVDRFESDDSYRLTRGVQFGSATGIQTVRYSNGDILWICSASAGGSITPLFPSATKNSGAAMIVLVRSTGNVVISTAGGTLQGSATLSASLGSRTWRSDGASWWPVGETRPQLPDPLAVGALTVAGSTSFSGSVAFATQPNFPIGTVTSITGGAMIAHAGGRLYEMSPGAATVALVLPSAATVRGLVAHIKIKNGSTGQVLLSVAGGRIEPASATSSATITMSGAYDYATLVAGQVDWWIT